MCFRLPTRYLPRPCDERVHIGGDRLPPVTAADALCIGITHTVRYRNIQTNPRVSVVVDDLGSTDPWSPRGIKVIGTAVIEDSGGSPRFRITPEVIISWAINDTTPGIPKMERRKVR